MKRAEPDSDRAVHRAAGCALLGYLALGVAHIAALPPFEGFDETAHYSYIQELADTGVLPRLGTAKLSSAVEAFQRVATSPYTPDPPFDRVPGHTYRTLASAPAANRGVVRMAVHGRTFAGRRYLPGTQPNWQAQHPPLFYAALGPVYAAVREWPLGRQLFALRLSSYLFAWLALALTVSTAFRMTNTHGSRWLVTGALIWPVLFPSWFPEMARLGNDSLCTLLVSGLWAFGVAGLTRPSVWGSVIVGTMIGVGCLTKAFFVGVAVGYFIHAVRRQRTAGASWRSIAVHGCLAAGTAALIAGWWYWRIVSEYGIPLGSADWLDIDSHGGLIAALNRNGSVSAWLRGSAAFVAAFLWPGSWSLARPPYGWLAPLFVAAVLGVILFLRAVAAEPRAGVAHAALWLALPVVAGFGYYVLMRVALTGEGGASGHYLHFLVTPLATALAVACSAGARCRFGRWLLAILVSYAAAFGVLMTWAQLLLFGGLAVTDARKFYRVPGDLPAWLGIPAALRNLEPIAYPSVAVIAFVVGALLVAAGGVQLFAMRPVISTRDGENFV